jgi:hypothetical protein
MSDATDVARLRDVSSRSASAITSVLQAGVRQLEKEAATLRWLRSFALVGEETYLCFVAAYIPTMSRS